MGGVGIESMSIDERLLLTEEELKEVREAIPNTEIVPSRKN